MARVGLKAVAALGAMALCIPAAASAQAPAPGASEALQDCLTHVIDNEHGSRWPAVLICYQEEFNSQDRRLQEAYDTLQTVSQRLGPRALGEIAAGRKSWEGYRDSWCAYEQEQFIKPNSDVALMTCRIEVTKTQLARVNEQISIVR